MYQRILKKDLKRKKTMNIILLIFIILAAIFISSSVNNLISISSATKSYFKKAELTDFIIITMKDAKNDTAITDFLNKDKQVDSWVADENLYMTDDNIKLENGKKFSMSTSGMISSFHVKQQKFFNSKDEEITNIPDGKIYMPITLMDENHLKAGDVFTITDGDFSKKFTILGNCKDAFLGSTMVGTSRFIMNDNDYKKVKAGTKFTRGEMYSINTSDIDKLEHDYNQKGFNVIVSCDKKMITTTYIMDMMLAGLLLVVSICLILISMVILRFTIVFTLNDEYREIGIMKAIGIRERKIRGLYIIKYLAISIIGAMIGFAFSIPFGNMFIKKVSRNIVMTGDKGIYLNLLFSMLIVIIVVLFCYSCTHHINKFSPVDAIRNGSSGERFKRKGFVRLNKSKLSAVFFMAINDILSEPKKFGALIITFTLGIILIIVPVNTVNTLKSDQLVSWFGMSETDVYLVNEYVQTNFIAEGRDYIKKYFKKTEDKLKKNGIDASVSSEMIFKYNIAKGKNKFNTLALQGTGVTTDQYRYTKGQPPKYKNEVALTAITADKIRARIGDSVMVMMGGKEKKYIVTAIYQSMNNMGEGLRFSEKEKLDYENAYGGFALQIKYNDNPSKNEIKDRFHIIKKLFPKFDVNTGGEYINKMIGNIAGQIDDVKQIILLVIIIINMLVAVLMVKTFITKEKGEIGMLKSIGFRNSAIIKWQILRIGIILLISTLLGALLSNPIAQISSGKIFQMMGASHIEFVVKPLEVYVFYPLLIFVLTLIASGITALPIKDISTQETNNIE